MGHKHLTQRNTAGPNGPSEQPFRAPASDTRQAGANERYEMDMFLEALRRVTEPPSDEVLRAVAEVERQTPVTEAGGEAAS